MLAGNEELDSYAENGPMINFPDLLSNNPMKELYLCDIDDIIRKISRTAKYTRRFEHITAHVKRWRK